MMSFFRATRFLMGSFLDFGGGCVKRNKRELNRRKRREPREAGRVAAALGIRARPHFQLVDITPSA
jgi:hypothetical protein